MKGAFVIVTYFTFILKLQLFSNFEDILVLIQVEANMYLVTLIDIASVTIRVALTVILNVTVVVSKQ